MRDCLYKEILQRLIFLLLQNEQYSRNIDKIQLTTKSLHLSLNSLQDKNHKK